MIDELGGDNGILMEDKCYKIFVFLFFHSRGEFVAWSSLGSEICLKLHEYIL